MKLAEARRWRRAVASFTLVLFAFQSYFVQTHVHLLLQGILAASVQAAVSAPAERGTPTPADNPETCPLCLDMMFAGHFTAPGAIALPLPPQIATLAVFASAVPGYVAAVSHIWLGRAPPKH